MNKKWALYTALTIEQAALVVCGIDEYECLKNLEKVICLQQRKGGADPKLIASFNEAMSIASALTQERKTLKSYGIDRDTKRMLYTKASLYQRLLDKGIDAIRVEPLRPKKNLTGTLEEWFDTPFEDIPKEIQKTIKGRYDDWNNLTSELRRSTAEWMDNPYAPETQLQHDPKAEELDECDFELVSELQKWENMDAKSIPSEEAIKEKKIQEIKEEMAKVGEFYRNLPESIPVEGKDEARIKKIGKILRQANPKATVTDIKHDPALDEFRKRYASNNKDFVGQCLKRIGVKNGRKGVKPKPLPVNPFKKN